MTEFLTTAQMKEIESAAIRSGAVTGLDLMERAGHGVVEAVFSEWPALTAAPQRAVVLCGPGNNGGDGFVVARLLTGRGWRAEVFLYGNPDTLPPDAKVNCERWRAMGRIRPLTDEAFDGYARDHPDTGLAVDAIFGIGLSRPFLALPRVRAALNTWQAASRDGNAPHVVAIDLPSGMDGDTGLYPGCSGEDPPGSCVTANLTVTFHRRKLGHVSGHGPQACGKLVVRDIGL